MMNVETKKLDNEQLKKQFLEELKENIAQCLYLTIDLEMYGLNDPKVNFYYDLYQGRLNTLIMKYYDSVQIFSPNDNWNGSIYVDFIRGLDPIAICGKKQMIEQLRPFMQEYYSEYGIVVADNRYREFPQFKLVRQAIPQDAKKSAELMFSTEEFSQNNSLDMLEKQLFDRMRNGIGRSFVIEEDGMIVAHTAIYAECGNAAVESGLVVHNEYVKKFYGLIIHEYIKKVLTEEKKTLYGLRYNETMQNSARKEDLDVRAECGRLIKRR